MRRERRRAGVGGRAERGVSRPRREGRDEDEPAKHRRVDQQHAGGEVKRRGQREAGPVTLDGFDSMALGR